jgi:hypothetical protein
MKTIRVGWKYKPETDKIMQDRISEHLGLFIEDDDLLEITLIHEIDYECDDDDIIIDVMVNGISLAGVFIPYSNIACIMVVDNEA